jgi:hypothetical protein
MKKIKFSLIAMAILVLFVSVAFIGCGENDNAAPVKEVKVTALTAANTGWILSWDAVGGNIDEYVVYIQQKDKIAVVNIGSGQNFVVYNLNGSDATVNTDSEKYSYKWMQDATGTVIGEFRFGVRSTILYGAADYSRIVWSDNYYTLRY